MEQREVSDKNGTTWVCVQAYTGTGESNTKKATELTETENNKIPVVCTPNGGAQTVRLKLSTDWMEQLTDKELLERITEQQ